MIDPRGFAEIRLAHPFPWTQGTRVGRVGEIVVLDANRAEVPLFTMLRIVALVTAPANNPPPVQPQPQQS